MEDTVLKVAMAAFFHDLGKLVHGDFLGLTREYRQNNAGLYQPQWDGRHTHYHALFTAWFLEHPEIRPLLPDVLNQPGWGKGDSFLNLAAMHHKPETPMQWIVTEADRLSSGYDRKQYEDARRASPRDYRKVRLATLFEQLDPTKDHAPDPEAWAYRLAPLGPETVFPERQDSAAPDSRGEATGEYEALVRNFVEELGRLRHAGQSVPLWFEHFDSLVFRHAALVPSDRSGNTVPDVSLYEHLRTTSALAAALFLYHREVGTLEQKAIKREDEAKFLVISGDFYGIQSFISTGYGEARKLRSKLLRGRSFAVSLMTDLAADLVLDALGLPFSSCTYSAAGKFTIVAPNTEMARQAVREADGRINSWLHRMTFGRSGLGVTMVEAAPSGFTGDESGYPALLDRVAAAMEARKCQRFDSVRFCGAVEGYLDAFGDGQGACALCGNSPPSPQTREDRYVQSVDGPCCALCRDHVFLGERMAASVRRLAVTKAGQQRSVRDNALLLPVFDRYQVAFVAEDAESAPDGGELLHLWDLGRPGSPDWSSDVSLRQMGGYIPRIGEDIRDLRLVDELEAEGESAHKEAPKTFSMIAAMARNPGEREGSFLGIAALGVLKADVDDLGLLMACGVPRGRHTMSRIATLSRQIQTFFGAYLPHLLATNERFNDVYTVFAGGDDLFLIGPWNRTLDLALFLNREFARYTCHNPHLHFSAGMSVHRPGTPVPAMAQAAESALEAAKQPEGKNRLSVFGATAEWGSAHELVRSREALEAWFADGVVNKAFLYRMNDFITMAAAEKRIGSTESIPIADMDCTRWRSLLAYNVERNVAVRLPAAERQDTRRSVHTQVHQWLEKHGQALRMALWSILYNIRRR